MKIDVLSAFSVRGLRLLILLSLLIGTGPVQRARSQAPQADALALSEAIGPQQAIAIALDDLTAGPQATGFEIGADDFRISEMGLIENGSFVAFEPDVAYNPAEDQYLVVWSADNHIASSKVEIYGQLVDAATGEMVGHTFRISYTGPEDDSTFTSHSPAVAYNSLLNEYLVVWYGDDEMLPGVPDTYEIFGQRLDADGNATGEHNFRISDTGPHTNIRYVAHAPAVAYNSVDNRYLVAWTADREFQYEFEIYTQLLNADGSEFGVNDRRISHAGPDGAINYRAERPAIAYNSGSNEYLVVWHADDAVDEEMEIYGQRLDASGAEVGADDFRISNMGPNGSTAFNATVPAVAYNSTSNEYLVVWHADHTTNDEYEIYGQRLSASGAEIGANDFRISNMGPDGDTNYRAEHPAVAYNSASNEYLVVWQGHFGYIAPDVDGQRTIPEVIEYGIYGQRLDAAGKSIGANDFPISNMNIDSVNHIDMAFPSVAFSSQSTGYLVSWHGLDYMSPTKYNEFIIYGRRLNVSAAKVGADDYRISGPAQDSGYDAYMPQVAYNSVTNQYLVVWSADDNADFLDRTGDDFEIYGQILDAGTGVKVGPRIRISEMGPDGNRNYDAYNPAVTYNSAANEYLVVWHGNDTDSMSHLGHEIFGQRLSASGAQIGANDFIISSMGPDGDYPYRAYNPSVAYNRAANEYLVVWHGNDTNPVGGELEIYGQRLTGNGTEIGEDDFRISSMGPDGNAGYSAYSPKVVYNSVENEYLVVWHGDDHSAPLVNDEFEIYGQRLDASGAEIGEDDFRISSMGPDGDASYGAFDVALSYNNLLNQYLVVWHGDNDTGSLVNDEFEIFGQRLDASGAEIGEDDFRISTMGANGEPAYLANAPAVTYNSLLNEYLVVWSGHDNPSALPGGEMEIFGQRLDADGIEIGADDFRLSRMGPDDDPHFIAAQPATVYSSTSDEYLVVWSGDDTWPPVWENELEIYGQRYAIRKGIYLPMAFKP